MEKSKKAMMKAFSYVKQPPLLHDAENTSSLLKILFLSTLGGVAEFEDSESI